VSDTENHDTTKVRTANLREAIALLSYDAKAGYKGNDTVYADRRHAVGRVLAEDTDIKYTEYPDVATHFPEELYEGLDNE